MCVHVSIYKNNYVCVSVCVNNQYACELNLISPPSLSPTFVYNDMYTHVCVFVCTHCKHTCQCKLRCSLFLTEV